MSDTTVAINNLNLTCIESGVFWPMNPISRAKITSVEINDNMLDTLPKNTLNAFPNLETLNSIRGKLKYFPDGFFAELKSLKTLSIYQNSLAQMPDISALNLLMSVNFGSNSIINIPIGYLPNTLQALYVYSNQLTQWPPIQGLVDLRTIQSNNNPNLGQIPAVYFIGLTNLMFLQIRSCGLTAMPDLWSSHNQLSVLDMVDNQISTIPNNYFSGMTALQTLNIKSNRLSNIPNTFSGLVSLRYIVLSDNSGILTTSQFNVMMGSGYFSILTQSLKLYLKSLGTPLTSTSKNTLQNQLRNTNPEVTVLN
jgi:Leucine-rich repeat (LRR) protein